MSVSNIQEYSTDPFVTGPNRILEISVRYLKVGCFTDVEIQKFSSYPSKTHSWNTQSGRPILFMPWVRSKFIKNILYIETFPSQAIQ